MLAALRGLVIVAVAALAAASARGATKPKPGGLLGGVGFDQNLNTQIPLDVPFRDETGKPVLLGDYFGKRPVILTLVYYKCPMLCTQELNGLTRNLRPLSLTIGKDFDVVTVSISPTETPDLAAAKKETYLRRYARPGSERGWHFLTGDAGSIERLARAVGFRYVYNPQSTLYAHAAGLAILTPTGRIARYFYGIDYPAKDLRFGLVEASAGRIGTPIDQLLLYCYHYDPATGKYNFVIMNAIRVLGTATALTLGTFMLVMFRRERRLAGLALLDTPPGPAIP